MRIKFKPISKINRWINGKTTTVFLPTQIYVGIKQTDGTIIAESPYYDRPIKISENDVFIQK